MDLHYSLPGIHKYYVEIGKLTSGGNANRKERSEFLTNKSKKIGHKAINTKSQTCESSF